jgi:hypothetical protein
MGPRELRKSIVELFRPVLEPTGAPEDPVYILFRRRHLYTGSRFPPGDAKSGPIMQTGIHFRPFGQF